MIKNQKCPLGLFENQFQNIRIFLTFGKFGSPNRQQVIPKNDVRAPIVTCQNDSNSYYATNSGTTTDEESERTHKRAHSEGNY